MADYSKDLYDYKYECIRNCSAFDDGYNQALDDFRKRINDFLIDSSDFADFVVTDSTIDCVIDVLKK